MSSGMYPGAVMVFYNSSGLSNYSMKLNAFDPPQLVVIKGVRAMNEQDPEGFVQNELNIWRLLNDHLHIVPFLGIANLDRWLGPYTPPLAVCHYYEEGSPREFFRRKKPSCEARLELLIGFVRGVAHIHSQSVVHGDLKGANIVVESAGDKLIAKIADFGSSRFDCSCCKSLNTQVGTPLWDSPEVAAEESGRTVQSDIWAVGCVALEVQLDTFPYTAGGNSLNNKDLRRATARQRRGDLPAKKADFSFEGKKVSEAVWEAFQDCWSVVPEERPSAEDLAGRLEGTCMPIKQDVICRVKTETERLELGQ
ncbi:kinase-like domain-containing protein [Rhizoctonia solani]|nr:kinase-like domain-containing protein [Rhizoctonia solani]